jgi:drug/metabolite transporter (DMT)-like permease
MMQTGVILACVAAIVLGQILFKIVALDLGAAGLAGLLDNYRAAALLAFALTLYAAATLAWIWVLGTVPLSRAYLFMSLSFAAVPILAHFVLGERLSLQLLAGALLIVAGILVTARAA